jgi:release factor glutamine methyltransferase
MNYSLQQTSLWVKEQLKNNYPMRETEHFLFLIYESVLHLSRMQVIMQADTKIPNSAYNQIVTITKRLLKSEPIQYILGETEFYDLNFSVNSSVLIPRPETEELVDWIIKTHKDNAVSILDIGVGSGCIAISLSKNLPKSNVYALDVSPQALHVAQHNAQTNNSPITFIEADILSQPIPEFIPSLNIIVSNPPYVTHAEKKLMQDNVLDYEPELALFVENNDPLLFYRIIAQKAKHKLTINGWLYFEINEALGNELIELLTTEGYTHIELRTDIHGKNRMLRSQLKQKTNKKL